MAQGTNANASGSYSMSIGYDTVASAGSAISFGYLAKSLGTRSISIGREASAGTASTDPTPLLSVIRPSLRLGILLLLVKRLL